MQSDMTRRSSTSYHKCVTASILVDLIEKTVSDFGT
jgi:hypothetical protein